MIRKFTGTVSRAAARILFCGIVLPLLFMAEPFYKIRLGILRYQRIGHLALNTDAFLRRQQLNGVPPRTFYLFAVHDPANQQLSLIHI